MSKKLTAKEIKALPAPISKHVVNLKKRYRTRNVKLNLESPGFQLYLNEGATYTLWNQQGEEMTLNMVSERTIGAAAQYGGANYQVGQRVPLPQGTWVVEFEFFMGKPFIRVYHVGVNQIA